MNWTVSLLFVLLMIGAASCAQKCFIRYGNSMPQFGSATVNAYLPTTSLFSSVPGGFLTSYTNVTAKTWVFSSQYPTNVTALSYPYSTTKDKFYSLFTYQTESTHLLNKLIEDRSVAFNATTPIIRTINLLQFNFPLDIFNLSNNVLIFSNVSYGQVTEYKPVPVGDYQLYWESSEDSKKRFVQTGGNVTGDPVLHPGKAYSHWIMPTGSFIIQDGVISTRKRSVSTRNVNLRARKEIKQNKQFEAKKVAEQKENGNDSSNAKQENKAPLSSR
jgi:hypothetical protein